MFFLLKNIKIWHFREWEDQGNKWVQGISSTPATRLDVINLQVPLFTKCLSVNSRTDFEHN